MRTDSPREVATKKFTVGLEFLTGLSLGTAALAVVVALILSFLVLQDFRSEATANAALIGTMVTEMLPDRPDGSDLRQVYDGLLTQSGVDCIALIDTTGTIVASAGPGERGASVDPDDDGWSLHSLESGYLLGISLSRASRGGFVIPVMVGLAALACGLVVLALFTPRWLRERVVTPLRSILDQADQVSPGGGRTAETASASFHKLVQLLAERDSELSRLKEMAEQRADALEERAETVLASISSAVLAVDSTWRLKLFNQSAADLFSLTEDDLERPFPADRTEVGSAIAEELSELPDQPVELDLQTGPESDRRAFGVYASPSGPDEVAVLVTDVSAVRRLERRIAEEASMADLGAVSAGISHEMGNSLCALAGFIDLLAKGHRDERTASILSEARNEVESARRMIDSFKSMAGTPDRPAKRLGAEDVLSMLTELCEKVGKRCGVTHRGKAGAVMVDPILLRRCLQNLINNSLEASEDVKVELSLEVRDDEDVFRIEVADDGPGLDAPPDEVFRPFFTTKQESGTNMGLGLSITRRIISSLGGSIVASNRSGGGARFVMTLPMENREANGE
jgi:C4-dicarboxylate-specific signal transduction histidine kinase